MHFIEISIVCERGPGEEGLFRSTCTPYLSQSYVSRRNSATRPSLHKCAKFSLARGARDEALACSIVLTALHNGLCLSNAFPCHPWLRRKRKKNSRDRQSHNPSGKNLSFMRGVSALRYSRVTRSFSLEQRKKSSRGVATSSSPRSIGGPSAIARARDAYPVFSRSRTIRKLGTKRKRYRVENAATHPYNAYLRRSASRCVAPAATIWLARWARRRSWISPRPRRRPQNPWRTPRDPRVQTLSG